MNKQPKLDQIKTDIVQSNICPDLAQTANNLVFGSGNLNADVLFIGEAPGKKEDMSGLPFIGAAGKMLDKMLSEISLNRDQVYITNIVKYRPPDNRDPKPDEKNAFWPYLVKQIEVIDPKLVVTLGRHPMNAFLPNAKIGEVHGISSVVNIQKESIGKPVVILPLYHPAAALYNGGLRETLSKDFENIALIINKLKKRKLKE